MGIRVSIRKLCRWLEVPRSSLYREPRQRRRYRVNAKLAFEIRQIINQHPAYGVRRITWMLNRDRDHRVNRKAVHRVLRLRGWILNKRPKGWRPRARSWRSQAEAPNERWEIDTTHFCTARDGWCHVTAVIDCADRVIAGWRASQSGKADVAAAALEDAVIRRKPGRGLTLRSDNGLVFGSSAFHKAVQSAGIRQEYITPYTPEQNGLIERWFRTLKEECLWLHNFETLEEAQEAIDRFIHEYNTRRPHTALGMKTPHEYFSQLVA